MDLVRLMTIDSGFEWAELSRRNVADWLKTDERHARRLIDEIVSVHRVLERRPGAGCRARTYRFTDPTTWRHVPWRFESDTVDELGRPPELVRRRVANALFCAPGARSNDSVVARYSALQASLDDADSGVDDDADEPVAVSYQRATTKPLRRATSAPQTRRGPSSSTRRGEGRPGGSKRALEKREEETEPVTLSEAAKAVRTAIIRAHVGQVGHSLTERLAKALADVEVPDVDEIVAAIPDLKSHGQGPPAMVTWVEQAVESGLADPYRDTTTIKQIEDTIALLTADITKAEAEGDEKVATIFRADLARWQNRRDRKRGDPGP